MTTEVDRASATLSERIAGIERTVQPRSNTPATMSIQSPSGREDLEQQEARIDARFQAFTHEVDQFREESAERQTKHSRSGLERSSIVSLHK